MRGDIDRLEAPSMACRYRYVAGDHRYAVGTDGSIWSAARGPWRRLRPYLGRKGYLSVELGTRKMKVHRLVLEAFVGPCPEGKQACHWPDPDKENNRLDNLRWDTAVENARDKTWCEGVGFLDGTRRCLRCKRVFPKREFRDGREARWCKSCLADPVTDASPLSAWYAADLLTHPDIDDIPGVRYKPIDGLIGYRVGDDGSIQRYWQCHWSEVECTFAKDRDGVLKFWYIRSDGTREHKHSVHQFLQERKPPPLGARRKRVWC